MKSKSRVEGLEWAGRLVLRFMGGPFLGVSRAADRNVSLVERWSWTKMSELTGY